MGNNTAYSAFQHTVITIYNHGALTLELLDELARFYAGMDIDSGGDTGLVATNGKTLEEICIGLIDPEWVPVKREDSEYVNPKYWEEDEWYDKWHEINDERWGWR